MKSFLVLLAVVVLTAFLRGAIPLLVLPLLPLLPLTAIGVVRYQEMRERQRQMQCPKCDLRLSYRPLSRSHGMLECPLMCGYRRLVGDPRAGR